MLSKSALNYALTMSTDLST